MPTISGLSGARGSASVVLPLLVAGCYLPVAYAPPPGLDGAKQGALVLAVSVVDEDTEAGAARLDIYSFSSGCPDISYRLRDRGYRGSVPMPIEEPYGFVLPGEEPVLLKAEWKAGSRACATALAFRPRPRTRYLLGFVPPEPSRQTCGFSLKEILTETGEELETLPVRNVRTVGVRHDYWSGFVTTGNVCAMARIPSDEPARRAEMLSSPSSPSPPPTAEATPSTSASASASVPPSAVSEAVEPSHSAVTRSTEQSPVAKQGGENDQAHATVTTPVVQPSGRPAAALGEPRRSVSSSRDDDPDDADGGNAGRARISGYAIGLRFGFAAGGATVARATAANGSRREVTLGGGSVLAAELKLTPLWVRDVFGIGLGAELGRKAQQISATNGTLSLTRYPLLVTAHVIARVAPYFYLIVAGGVEKHLDVSLTGSGAAIPANGISLSGRMGPTLSLSLAYALTHHWVFDAVLRFAALDYTVNGEGGSSTRESASYGGFTMGAHYHF